MPKIPTEVHTLDLITITDRCNTKASDLAKQTSVGGDFSTEQTETSHQSSVQATYSSHPSDKETSSENILTIEIPYWYISRAITTIWEGMASTIAPKTEIGGNLFTKAINKCNVTHVSLPETTVKFGFTFILFILSTVIWC